MMQVNWLVDSVEKLGIGLQGIRATMAKSIP
jgi:hypothetical protein